MLLHTGHTIPGSLPSKFPSDMQRNGSVRSCPAWNSYTSAASCTTISSVLLSLRCVSHDAHANRPANILLSDENVPVLVDFGFAERYDVESPEAFHSNLSYGTPEVRPVSLRELSMTDTAPDYMRLLACLYVRSPY